MPKTLPLLVDISPICCDPLASQSALSAADAVALAVRLKAIADPTRLQLVAFLLGAPNWQACTCDLAPVVGLSEATVSHHLRRLLEAGLCTKRRDGMNVWYRLVPESLLAISRMLDPGLLLMDGWSRCFADIAPRAHAMARLEPVLGGPGAGRLELRLNLGRSRTTRGAQDAPRA